MRIKRPGFGMHEMGMDGLNWPSQLLVSTRFSLRFGSASQTTCSRLSSAFQSASGDIVFDVPCTSQAIAAFFLMSRAIGWCTTPRDSGSRSWDATQWSDVLTSLRYWKYKCPGSAEPSSRSGPAGLWTVWLQFQIRVRLAVGSCASRQISLSQHLWPDRLRCEAFPCIRRLAGRFGLGGVGFARTYCRLFRAFVKVASGEDKYKAAAMPSLLPAVFARLRLSPSPSPSVEVTSFYLIVHVFAWSSNFPIATPSSCRFAASTSAEEPYRWPRQ
ncbi:hypothetical protein K438DRAFT_1956375 [Mycena galopus ATCC 62051]|nr:hypothetical protein K438DRAFT_1956375 [Mycena galopus ATCC 62051]